jgi:small subunit ribosomal protein S6
MYKYELVIITKVSLTEEKRKAFLKKIEEMVKKAGGRLIKIDDWGKRTLAYPIKKQNEGFYSLLDLDFDQPVDVTFSNKIKLEEEVVRSLLIKKE